MENAKKIFYLTLDLNKIKPKNFKIDRVVKTGGSPGYGAFSDGEEIYVFIGDNLLFIISHWNEYEDGDHFAQADFLGSFYELTDVETKETNTKEYFDHMEKFSEEIIEILTDIPKYLRNKKINSII